MEGGGGGWRMKGGMEDGGRVRWEKEKRKERREEMWGKGSELRHNQNQCHDSVLL